MIRQMEENILVLSLPKPNICNLDGKELQPTVPTREERDEILKEHFWMKAAILLRQAQNHMRRPEFGYYMKTFIPADRMMILQTFQHYILVCLGRGEIADPWLQFEADWRLTRMDVERC